MNVQNYNHQLATLANSLPYAKQVQIKPYSNFLNFTLDELIFLIKDNVSGDIRYGNDQYAEKLLRFCEFNLWDYKKKLKEKKMGYFETRLFHNLFISLFLIEYLISLDYRYFNVALKLNEITFSNVLFFNNAADKNVFKLISINNSSLIESILEDE
jgi:hypothetical protein